MFRNTDSCITVGSSNGGMELPERRNPRCQRLRIDATDGSPAEDYRIENGRVEHRDVATAKASTEAEWQRLTAEQLTSHVMTNTILAHWLHRRLGLHSLVRAYSKQFSSASQRVQ